MKFLERHLEAFASEKQRLGWRGVLWFCALVLAPVAYVAAIVLGSRLPNPEQKFLRPDQAVSRARELAGRLGADTRGWEDIVIAFSDSRLVTYFDDPRFQALPAEQKPFAPYSQVRVTLLAKRRPGQWARFSFRPDGSLLAFQLGDGVGAPFRSNTEEEAREVAREGLQRWLNPPASLKLGEAELLPGDTAETRRFQWKGALEGMPPTEMNLTFTADVRGDRLVRVASLVAIDTATLAKRKGQAVSLVGTLRSALFISLVLYGCYCFARRARDREVAWTRCLVLFSGVLILALGLLLSHRGLYLSNEQPDKLIPTTVMFLFLTAATNMLLQGIMLALAYGGAEGEIREIYPGKLTSLDAVLTGRFFNRQVGAAVLTGIALAGWALLLQMTGEHLFPSRIPRFAANDVTVTYSHHGWFALLVNHPLRVAFACAFGLLIPMMLVNRHVASRRWRLPLLVAGGMLGASMGVPLDYGLHPWILLLALLLGLVILSAFRARDFLAALVGANLFLIGHTVSLLGPMGGDWLSVVRITVMFAVMTAVWAFAAVYKGGDVDDEMVRPKYAERLLERLGLKAEASTAREAQLRLLPSGLPQVAGLRVAASCTPAAEVGGDFYDFFTLPRGRLGVLVAEGGSTGLASALSIGLAKGFLLYAAERDWSAGESLRRLRPVLLRAVKGNIERLGLAYIVMDPAGAVRIARFGAYPKLMELVPGEAPREVELLGVAEEDFVGERTITLAERSTLLMVTDGFLDRLRRKHAMELADWLSSKTVQGATELHGALLGAVGPATDLTDDVTLVLVQREAPAMERREGVA